MTFEYRFYETRRGTGIAQARRLMRYMLADVRNSSGGGGGFFWIAALDNDRSPQHPDGARPPGVLSRYDQQKRSRYAELLAEAGTVSTTVPGAIAVPVEMIESWVLQALSPGAKLDLPSFPEQSAVLAITYYRVNHRTTPPPQLKDLAVEAMRQRQCSDWYEFLIEVAGALNPDALAAHSRSFAQFRDAVASWPVA